MDFRQFRYFLAIAEAGTITGAAATLNVAQPSLSLHVKNLEEELGVQLLIRSKSGVSPTEAGTLLMKRARAILDDLARTKDDISTINSDPLGEVRIGLPGTISNIVALPLMEAIRERYPRIRLNVAEAMSGFIAEWMDAGQVDLAVLYQPSTSDSVVSQPLLQEELVVLWSANEERPEEIALADLNETQLVVPSGAHGLRFLIDTEMARRGVQPRVAAEIDSYLNIKRLVASGFGASILPRHSVLGEVKKGELKISSVSGPGLWRTVYLVFPKGRPATRAKEAVKSLVSGVVGALSGSGEWPGTRALR